MRAGWHPRDPRSPTSSQYGKPSAACHEGSSSRWPRSPAGAMAVRWPPTSAWLHGGRVLDIRGHEAIAAARHRGDVAGPPMIVLQLDAQVADVPVDHVALHDVVDAPQMVQDLVARQQPPR